jgi:hypothetical protein
MRVVKKLSTNQKLFLTTTHFHVEHAAGAAGFPGAGHTRGDLVIFVEPDSTLIPGDTSILLHDGKEVTV